MLPRNLFYDMLDEVNTKGMNSDVYVENDAYHIEIDGMSFTVQIDDVGTGNGNGCFGCTGSDTGSDVPIKPTTDFLSDDRGTR